MSRAELTRIRAALDHLGAEINALEDVQRQGVAVDPNQIAADIERIRRRQAELGQMMQEGRR